MYIVQCLIYIVHCIMYNIHCRTMIVLVQCIITLYIIHCTMNNVQCIIYIVQYTMYNVQCTIYIVYKEAIFLHSLTCMFKCYCWAKWFTVKCLESPLICCVQCTLI